MKAPLRVFQFFPTNNFSFHPRANLLKQLATWLLINIAAYPSIAQHTVVTLQSLGIPTERGRIAYPPPANLAVGLFDPDPLLDVAVFDDGLIKVYRNMGDGTFGQGPVFEKRAAGEVHTMHWRKSREMIPGIFYPDSWGDLVIEYADGRGETITHEMMLSSITPPPSMESFPSHPPMVQSLGFHEVWRSVRNPGPHRRVQIGDIDNDGNTEVLYAIRDSVSTWSRLTVFENYGHGLYRVEWDSLMQSGVPLAITDIDNDGNKEIVIAYTVPFGGAIGFLECLGEGQFRFYQSNIGYTRPPFKVMQIDVNRNGKDELVVLTSNPSLSIDPTIVYVNEFISKGPGPGGWYMGFNSQLARYQGYTFDMAVGQVDGEGWLEIVPAGGSFGYLEPVPVDYLWYSGLPNPNTWLTRRIHTGLESGTGAVMFVDLDGDSTLEFVSGAPGPIGSGSMYALRHVSDTTWQVLWADSSLRNSPLWVNSGILNGEFVVAGANTWGFAGLDTLYSELNAYHPAGSKMGLWRRDSMSIQNFHFLDIDQDARTNLVFAQLSVSLGDHLVDYESDTTVVGLPAPSELPDRFELSQNYPNPFNPSTAISVRLTAYSQVRLRIYDLLGREVKTLIDQTMEAGTHTVHWQGTTNEGGDAASGVYFCRVIVRGTQGILYTHTIKMLLLR